MDDATYAGLRAALAATPSNVELLKLLAPVALQRGEAQALLVWLEAAGEAGQRPELLIARARALSALYRSEEALRAYERAVAANPVLEDADLRLALEVQMPSGGEGKARQRVGGERDADPSAWIDSPRPVVRFADVGGHEGIKDKIRKKIILPMQKPSLFQRFRRKAGGGVLMYGPPGCGKTLLARATAGECNYTFLNVQIADVLDMYIGESERKLHALFEKARAAAPAVLFFDEVEALGAKRSTSHDSATSKLVSQFLTEMDGFASRNENVLILGATNVPWAVDPAFRRPGRFDRVLFVPPPDRGAREAILRLHLSDRPVAPGLDVDAIAQKTSGYSGADLENVVDTAADAAIESSLATQVETPIQQGHLLAALQEVRPTTLEWLTTARNHARYANEGGQYDEVLEFLNRNGR
jgi:transitional endoplasmic reticulum ATPase